MSRNRIHIQEWNPDTNLLEWVGYSVKDVDFLLEKEVIDVDWLGFSMTDSRAFDIAMDSLLNRSATYSEFVETYLENTTKDIWMFL